MINCLSLVMLMLVLVSMVAIDSLNDNYLHGRRSIFLIGSLMLAFGTAIIAILYFLSERFVLSRLIRLNRAISAVVSGRDLSVDARVPGNDEISDLANHINSLLRNLDASQKDLRNTIDFLPDPTFAIDLEGRVTIWNRAMEELSGVKAADMLGKGDHEYALPIYGKRRPLLVDAVLQPAKAREYYAESVLNSNGVLTAETASSHPGGKLRCFWCQASLLFNSKGEVVGAIEAMRDVTIRKKNESLLNMQARELELRARVMEHSLKEKEVLLKEVNHRVKNNLQVISSLLRLQSKYLVDMNDYRMFMECEDRVKSMVFIHEKLYRSKDFANVDFGSYIGSLARSLFISYGIRDGRVSLAMSIGEDIRLGVDTAIPCGLIINELVSNSLKHAFPGEAGGTIGIGFRREEDGAFELTVMDDGAGMPAGLDFRNTASLGLQLVVTLVEQLGGTIRTVNVRGTTFIIRFREAAATAAQTAA